MKIEFDNYMIRDWVIEDVQSLAKYANNRKIWINMRDRFAHPYEVTDAENFIQNALNLTPKTMFAISNNMEAIGSIGLHIKKDVHRFTAEMGYWLGEPFWSKGIMTEVLKRFTKCAFENFKLHRIYAEPYATNHASMRVLEKVGFEREGVLRANVYKDGRVLDQVLYAKIKK